MKIKSVELMRNIRKTMSDDLQGMSWHQEKQYIKKRITSLKHILLSHSGEMSEHTSPAMILSENSED
jgi:hypothetical protein